MIALMIGLTFAFFGLVGWACCCMARRQDDMDHDAGVNNGYQEEE